MYNFLERMNGILEFKTAYAHCDIPCGIYDPISAQIAAHTVIRMVQLIGALPKEMNDDNRGKFVRYVDVKEKHAELCKHEVEILWGDYFKPEHAQQSPELHDLVWKTLKLGSKNKQEINMQSAEELLENVNKIAEIFWKTKNIPIFRAKAPYPTEKETVYPKLPT